MSLQAALAKHLDAVVDGLVYAPDAAGGNVFEYVMPATPDRAVAVTVDGGLPMSSKSPTRRPTAQIRCRDVTNDDAMALATSVLDALDRLDRTWLDEGGDDAAFLIGATAMQSEPVPLGLDPEQRHECVVNLSLFVHRPTTNRPATTGV